MAEEDTNVLDSGLSQTLTPKEYQESFVDFYRQTLGSTGIDVRDDDDDDDDDDKKDKGPAVITAPPISGDDDRFVSSSMSPSVELINLDNIEASSYQDVLAKNNVEDITKFDSFGITFSKPSKPTLKKASTVFGATKLLFPTIGLVGADLATAVVGEERTEVDGQTGYRPPGGLGLMYDLNNSIQTANINANKLAAQQNKLESEAADIAGTTFKRQPQGFSARINGQLVTRHHGKTYYEGVYDYTPEQLKSIEALRRGFNPSGYNLLTEQGDESIINTDVDKGYTERGTYVDINGTAAAGPEKEFQKLVSNSITQYRLDTNPSRRKAIENAIRGGLVKTRQGYSILGTKKEGAKTLTQNIKDAVEQFKKPTTTTDQSDDPKPTTTFTAEEVQKNIDLDDDFTYGDDNNDSDGGGGSSPSDGGGDFGMGDPAGIDFATGGRIGKQEGDVVVKEPGFIAPDPNATKQQEIADDKPMDARQGDFIINAPAAEEAGKQDIQRMINTAITNLQEKGVDVRFGDPKINIADKVKLLVSRNEVYIPAIIAKEIGYDRLKKINNRGKREVQRRQEESQQDEKPQARGFIQKKKGDVVEDRGFVTAPVTRDTATFTVFKNFLKKRKPLRADIENFIDTIPGDKGRLGVLAGAEAPLETSTLPELEAIIQTILNRVNDRTFEFRNVNSVKDIMKQRSSRGTGSKMFMYDGLERKFLRPRIKEIVKNPKVFQAGLDAAENVLTKGGGEPDYEMEMLPPNVFNYAKVGDASKRMSKNPKLKFYKRVGQHDFYERIP